MVLDTERLLTGRIGLVSQSGALMVSLFDRAAGEGIGFSACVPLGNQSDLEICDFLDYFIDDPATDALLRLHRGPARSAAIRARRCRVPTGRQADGGAEDRQDR